MQFKVRNLGLVTGATKSRTPHSSALTPPRNRLFPEEVGFSFLGECGFDHTGASRPDGLAVGERKLLGFSSGVLVDGQQRGCAAAFDEDFAHPMSGCLGGNHRNIHVGRRGDGPEANVEAVGKHQRLSGGEIGRDFLFVNFRRNCIRHQHHDDISPGRHFRGSPHGEAAGWLWRVIRCWRAIQLERPRRCPSS
jgi:hypothetical protein